MLKVDIHKPIASVLLDRPDIHNAFNDELVKLVTDAFTELGARDDVRVIVLRGNGKSFCAGADLNWMKRMIHYSREQNIEDARAVGRMYLTIANCPKPVIARVHGAALGGGHCEAARAKAANLDGLARDREAEVAGAARDRRRNRGVVELRRGVAALADQELAHVALIGPVTADIGVQGFDPVDQSLLA